VCFIRLPGCVLLVARAYASIPERSIVWPDHEKPVSGTVYQDLSEAIPCSSFAAIV
jgi:hypothetical protein